MILKNNPGKTFIRPFTELSSLMRLKLLNNKTVTIAGSGVVQNYLQVTKVNNKI